MTCHPAVSPSVKEDFEALYLRLKEYQQGPEVQVSSRPQDYLGGAAYQQIVSRGNEFLPLLVEKVREGDFFLNGALAEITGVDIRKKYSDARPLGEQGASALWLRWWDERQAEVCPPL